MIVDIGEYNSEPYDDTPDHIDIYYDHYMRDWCSDVIDVNGHYVENTGEFSATRALAIWRSKLNLAGLPIHVYVKGKSDPEVDSYKLIENKETN